MEDELRLSVVVPATNRPATLQRCLAAIRGASAAPEELLVVDEPPGLGPAASRNRGAAAATGDVLVFVDSDVVVHPDAFVRVRRRFADDPGLTAIFGAYDDRPEAPGTVSRFRNLLHHHVHVEAAGPVASFWAGLGAVRRDAFLESGGFDALRYPRPAIEDIELGVRLSAEGHRIELDPSIRGTHLKRWTLFSMVRSDLVDRGAPWIALALERRSFPTTLNLSQAHRLSALATLLLTAAGLRRRIRLGLSALAVFLVLNRSFYRLLARRLGAAQLPVCIVLHIVHQLVAVTAVPLGVATRLKRAVHDGRGGTDR